MYRIGIDLGGTNIAVGVVDEEYNIVGRGKMKTALPRSAKEIFADMVTACKMAVEDAGVTMDDVVSVGLGSPGAINKEDGVIEYSNNLKFDQVPACSMLSEALGKPVYIDNDANCAAFGEALAGAGKGVKNFVAITLGTGVGSGVVINGRIYSGSNSIAAEIGHMVIDMDGELCTCGRRGCWEAYSSATALIRQTKDAMRHAHDSVMWELTGNSYDNINGRTAFEAMRRGDAAGKAVVDRYIDYLGCGIVNVINIFQPEVLCIGGGISHEGDNLLIPLNKRVERDRYTERAKSQTILRCAQLGNDSGIIGAAFLDL